ncbi:metal-dependent hydrolase [Trinickia terrae]|nr:metal-dependent hydrolase [Trinickia terrae]
MNKTYSHTPVPLDFPVPEFDFAGCDARRWNGGSAVKSHFWNTFSSLLPNIEFCAIVTLLPIVKRIDDAKLNMETSQFCRQEGEHGNAHSRFNAQRLHPDYPFLTRMESWERSLFKRLSIWLPLNWNLALFVAVEHWTAAFSHFGLQRPDDWFSECDPTMFSLWEWHAVEELAHKSVCFDIFRYFGGSYFSRVAGMVLLLALIMLPGIFARMAYLFWKDGIFFKPATYKGLFSYLFSRTGVLRTTFLDFLGYFRLGYNPWNLDSRPLISAWESRNPVASSVSAPQPASSPDK